MPPCIQIGVVNVFDECVTSIPVSFTSTLKIKAAGFSRTYKTIYEGTVHRPQSKLMLLFASALTLHYE
jgi:hypothetical protein